MDEIKKILPFMSEPTAKKVPEKKTDKKKLDSIDKEGLQITGGLFPIYPSVSQTYSNQEKGQVKTKWHYVPIIYSKTQDTNIYHWVAETEKDRVFSYEKFIINADIVMFTKEEYNVHLSNIDGQETWTYEETLYLWDLCAQYNLRWPVIYDRYDYATFYEQQQESIKESDNQNNEQEKKEEIQIQPRTMEDLKARYYHIAKRIINLRGEKQNPLYNFNYDPQYDAMRKLQLEKFIRRNKEVNDEEARLLEELKKIQQVIKKEEKEQQNLQKILKMNQDELEEHEQGNEEFNFQKLAEEKQVFKSKKEKFCYLRGNIMHTPLPLSQKLNKKVIIIKKNNLHQQQQLQLALSELNIAQRPHPTQKNEELYDSLREKLLMMFSLQKHLKRKEIVQFINFLSFFKEKKIFDEKLASVRIVGDSYKKVLQFEIN